MSEPELWAARDDYDALELFHLEPIERHGMNFPNEDIDGVYIGVLPPDLLPSLAPGEKCRVTIVRDEPINQ